MNWRRGLFRLWAALAVGWAAFAVWMRHSNDSKLPDPPAGFRIDGGLRDWSFWLEIVLAPPVAVGALGLVVFWIVVGFRKSN